MLTDLFKSRYRSTGGIMLLTASRGCRVEYI